MKHVIRLGAFALLVLVLIQTRLASAPAVADSHPVDDQVYELAKKLNCPTCVGRALSDCGTPTCIQWKDEIKTQLQAGKGEAEVLAYFTDRFGPTVLQEPPKQGSLLVLWVTPVVGVFALSAVAVATAILVSRRKRHPPQAAETGASDVDEFADQLERQVAERL